MGRVVLCSNGFLQARYNLYFINKDKFKIQKYGGRANIYLPTRKQFELTEDIGNVQVYR